METSLWPIISVNHCPRALSVICRELLWWGEHITSCLEYMEREGKPWPFENNADTMGVNHQFGNLRVAAIPMSGSGTPDGNDFEWSGTSAVEPREQPPAVGCLPGLPRGQYRFEHHLLGEICQRQRRPCWEIDNTLGISQLSWNPKVYCIQLSPRIVHTLS